MDCDTWLQSKKILDSQPWSRPTRQRSAANQWAAAHRLRTAGLGTAGFKESIIESNLSKCKMNTWISEDTCSIDLRSLTIPNNQERTLITSMIGWSPGIAAVDSSRCIGSNARCPSCPTYNFTQLAAAHWKRNSQPYGDYVKRFWLICPSRPCVSIIFLYDQGRPVCFIVP